jgi:5-formyltetrahydrofolate cyclo-ligase
MQISQAVLLRQHIRKTVCQRRALLSSSQRAAYSDALAHHVIEHPQIQKAETIALFCSVNDEISTRPVIEQLWQQDKQLYLPALHPFSRGHLLFLRYTKHTLLAANRLKIPEPLLNVNQVLPLIQLDVVLVPVVAFDNDGQRLGMGAGFYDRTLQNWQQQGPYPIGLAYDFQRVDSCHPQNWDVPLGAVITPSTVWQWC